MIFRMRPSLRGPVGWPCASSNSSNRIWMTRSSSRRLFAGRWSSSVLIVSMSLGSGQREAGWIVFPGIEDHGPAVARILHVSRHEEEIMFDRGRGEVSVEDWRRLPGRALVVARDNAAAENDGVIDHKQQLTEEVSE